MAYGYCRLIGYNEPMITIEQVATIADIEIFAFVKGEHLPDIGRFDNLPDATFWLMDRELGDYAHESASALVTLEGGRSFWINFADSADLGDDIATRIGDWS